MVEPYRLPDGYIEWDDEVLYQQRLAKLRADHPDRKIIGAQRGPQTRMLLMMKEGSPRKCNFLIAGGSAGSNKTFSGLLQQMAHIDNPLYRGSIFRRTNADIRAGGGILDESRRLYEPPLPFGPGGLINDIHLDFRFPSGAKVGLENLQHAKDIPSLQGSQWSFAHIDEAVTFDMDMQWAIYARLRGVAGITPSLLGTTNPDADHEYRTWLDFHWLDEAGDPIHARSGDIKYMVRNPETDLMQLGHSREELVAWYAYNFPNRKPIPVPMSLSFVPSTVMDNHILMEADPDYINKLDSLPRLQRERFRRGNWHATAAAGDFYKPSWTKKVGFSEINPRWPHMWGFDIASSEKKGDFSCATLMARDPDGVFYVVDHKYAQVGPAEKRQWIRSVLEAHSHVTKASYPQDAGGSGKQDAYNVVRDFSGFTITTSPESGSKSQRMDAFTAQAAAGNVRVVKGEWMERWERILGDFPMGKIDDDVDSTSRAFHAIADFKVCNILGLG